MRTARSTERPAGALGSVLRLGERIALWAGIAAGAATGGAAFLWVVGREDKLQGVVHRAGFALATLQGDHLHGPELAVFAGTALAVGIPLAIVAWRSHSGIRRVISSWAPGCIGAYLYATTIPGPRRPPVTDGMFLPASEGGQDIVWPLLALGLMLAAVSAGALWQGIRQSRRRRWSGVCLSLAFAAAAGVVAVYLIKRGMLWMYTFDIV